MNNLESAYRQPYFLTLPDPPALLNGRGLSVNTLHVLDQTFPDQGTFAKLMRSRVTASVADQRLTITARGTAPLTLTLTRLDVFLTKINMDKRAPWLWTHVTYATGLRVLAPDYDFYLAIPGGLAAQFLVRHPGQLSIVDALHLAQLPEASDEYAFSSQLKAETYDQMVADTPFAFLANDRPSSLQSPQL